MLILTFAYNTNQMISVTSTNKTVHITSTNKTVHRIFLEIIEEIFPFGKCSL